jgi:microcystin-dependent protein
VRLYRRALDVEEINRVADDDLHGRTTYREEHPLTFAVVDDDDEARLAITDEGSPGRNLHLAIVNRSPFVVEFAEPDSTAEVVDAAHLELRFRPGTLSGESLARIAPVDREWQIATSMEDDGTHVLHLTHRLSRILLPGHRLAVTLVHVSADALLGARDTRVALRYRNVRFQESGVPCHGFGERRLAIHGRRGRRTVPFRYGVRAPRMVMNDGETATDLTAFLGNASKSTDIELRAGVAPTRFVLSFDCGAGPWDLGSVDHVANIDVPPPDGFDVDPRLHGETPEWVITPVRDITLRPGQQIEFALNEIRSSAPSGPARMLLRYDNLPGHWDGELDTTIEKSAIRYSAVENAAGESMTVPGTVTAGGFDTVGAVDAGSVAADTVTAGTLTSTGQVLDANGPVVPVGVIVMWSGPSTAVPAGWALCDGTNGTPNLRGRFVVGVDPTLTTSDAANYSKVGNTGGADGVTLTDTQMPAHTHASSSSAAGSHSHSFSDFGVHFDAHRFVELVTSGVVNVATGLIARRKQPDTGSHNHAVTVTSTGGGQAHENRPPFYVLAFIIKTAPAA